MYYSSGALLEGLFAHGEIVSGTYISADKSLKFSGNWKNGRRNGTGSLVIQNEAVKYDGEWMNDLVCFGSSIFT